MLRALETLNVVVTFGFIKGSLLLLPRRFCKSPEARRLKLVHFCLSICCMLTWAGKYTTFAAVMSPTIDVFRIQ